MKKQLLLFLTALLIAGTACGKQASPAEDRPQPSPVIVEAEVKVQTQEEKTEPAQRVETEDPGIGTPAETPQAPEPEETAAEATPEPVAETETEPARAEISDAQLDAGYLDSFFNGSVLVGDSLVAGLSGYVLQEKQEGRKCLGEMQLVSASALTLKKAMEAEQGLRGHELRLRNRYMSVTEVVSTLEAKKLFLMLGVSDPRWYSAEELVAAYDTLIGIVKAHHPDVEIFIHSIMPMVRDYAKQVEVSVEMNREVNRALEQYCSEKGYTYIQLADLVRDEEGYLVYEYSAGDYRFHLNKAGKQIWVRCLREIARDAYYAGTWSPEGD